MVWWQTLLVAVVLAIVLTAVIECAAAGVRRSRARQLTDQHSVLTAQTVISGSGTASVGEDNDVTDAASSSLFGRDVPVRQTEEALIRVMPDALIVTDRDRHVIYESPAATRLPLTENGHIASDELTDILTQVDEDEQTRERELALPRALADRHAASGRGVTAGDFSPSDSLYLKVRVGVIGDDLIAVFLCDKSEQRRFEAMRRDFVTNVSHELKTPAGAISLLAETVSDAADDPDAVRYFAGRITKESARLTELVHRLIDLQKAQSAGSAVHLTRVGMLAVARRAIADNQVQADASHIEIRLSVNGKDLPLTAPTAASAPAEPDVVAIADEEALFTAVKNLVENAIHYSPEHTTVRVAIARQPAESGRSGGRAADRAVSRDGGQSRTDEQNRDGGQGRDGGQNRTESANVTLRVIDQGIGIPRESLGRIFERFYRVDPARSRETGGTGLGLAITKHCVEDCGGTIAVWSRPQEGSTFTIELPAASDEADSKTDGETGDNAVIQSVRSRHQEAHGQEEKDKEGDAA